MYLIYNISKFTVTDTLGMPETEKNIIFGFRHITALINVYEASTQVIHVIYHIDVDYRSHYIIQHHTSTNVTYTYIYICKHIN